MDVYRDESKTLTILNSAVENTNEAFVTIDQDHQVYFFNKAAEEIFGYSREEVVGRDLDVVMTSNCSRDHHEAVARYVETKVPRRIGHPTEITATRKNGEAFPAEISFSVSEVEGKLYFTAIIRDMTETKALQDQITRSERLAALGQVVAEITHEIKNPLMMIGGFVRQLIPAAKDTKSLTKLHVIIDEVSRLENLLRELREYYLTRTLSIEEIDIGSLLEEVYLLVKDDCDRKKIRTELNLTKGPIVVQGDSGRLKQVFLNLIKNSIEAMESGGKLVVQSRLTGGQVEIRLSDNGCGIPEDKQEKIFAPFFTTKKHGTGLGLSISKSIIEDHRGSSLTLKSQEGKGTVFKITMPVYPSIKGDLNSH